MKLLAKYKDDVFPFSFIDHDRFIARAIVLNANKEILLLKISRDDDFGNATYYETPGGGIELNETIYQAAIREVKEECGLKINIVDEIGCVEDDYNIIHRHNLSNYILGIVDDVCDTAREEYEKKWIKKLEWINIDDAIKLLSKPKSDIEKVVYRREKIVLIKAKEIIDEYWDNIFGMCEK